MPFSPRAEPCLAFGSDCDESLPDDWLPDRLAWLCGSRFAPWPSAAFAGTLTVDTTSAPVIHFTATDGETNSLVVSQPSSGCYASYTFGCIRITDRSKDLVKSGGEWISSVDLENLLMAHPAVAEAAVIAIPDDKWGERPLAAVVLREGQEAGPDELREHLSKEFAKWQLPERIEFIDAIPRTATGKFRKTELRERFVQSVV